MYRFHTVIVVCVTAATACTPAPTGPTEKLYLTLAAPGSTSLVVIDPKTDRKIGTVGVGGEPHDVVCAPNGTKAYVSNPKSNSVSVVDTATDMVTATIELGADTTPWHIEVSPDGKRVFVALQGSKEVAIIDAETNKVSQKVAMSPTGNTRSPWALSAPTNNRVYATLNGIIAAGSANGNNEVAFFDPTEATPMVSYLTVGDGPHGIIANADKSEVIVATQKSHELWKISVASNTAVKITTIPATNAPMLSPGFPTDVAAGSGTAYLTGNHDIDSISFVSANGGDVSTVSTGVGSKPWGAIISPDGKKAYVSTSGFETISVFDMATKMETAKINVGPGPDGFAWCKRQ